MNTIMDVFFLQCFVFILKVIIQLVYNYVVFLETITNIVYSVVSGGHE